MVTIGIPVLNRYDLLPKAIDSAMRGSVVPDRILIVDNGGNCDIVSSFIDVHKPGCNLGVAGAWNYIVKNTTEHRIIINDDIEFCPDTVEKMLMRLDEGHEFVWTCRPFGEVNGFSCFALKDSLVSKIGYFDEGISPGYAYFEDNDYHRRMELAGVIEKDSEAEAIHAHSATLGGFTPEQMGQHHIRFALAQQNYVRKWGGMPHHETKVLGPFRGVEPPLPHAD